MKYNPQTHRFAVIQDGLTLYGVGKTRIEAVKDAADWIETSETPQGECSVGDVEKLLDHGMGLNIHGQFYVINNPEKIKQYVESV